jgi:hypothetical protein
VIGANGTGLAYELSAPPPGDGLQTNYESVDLLDLAAGASTMIAENASGAVFTPTGGALVLASTRNHDGLVEEGDLGPEHYNADLFRVDLTDGRWHELTHTRNIDESDPVISPGGNRLAYTSTAFEFPSLYQSNLNGSCREALGEHHALYSDPTWRPEPVGAVPAIRCSPRSTRAIHAAALPGRDRSLSRTLSRTRQF